VLQTQQEKRGKRGRRRWWSRWRGGNKVMMTQSRAKPDKKVFHGVFPREFEETFRRRRRRSLCATLTSDGRNRRSAAAFLATNERVPCGARSLAVGRVWTCTLRISTASYASVCVSVCLCVCVSVCLCVCVSVCLSVSSFSQRLPRLSNLCESGWPWMHCVRSIWPSSSRPPPSPDLFHRYPLRPALCQRRICTDARLKLRFVRGIRDIDAWHLCVPPPSSARTNVFLYRKSSPPRQIL
jgi:hypothetical protein